MSPQALEKNIDKCDPYTVEESLGTVMTGEFVAAWLPAVFVPIVGLVLPAAFIVFVGSQISATE